MKKYVALLRGINVGGNNIIKMDALRNAFEKMGFKQVESYIQSGNIVFQTKEVDTEKLEGKIEKELEKVFNYTGKVFIRTEKEIKKTVSHLPKEADNPAWKTNVMFLLHGLDGKKIVKDYIPKKTMEIISTIPGVIFWSAKKKDLAKAEMMKLAKSTSYKEMTVRNARTTRKIFELMNNQT